MVMQLSHSRSGEGVTCCSGVSKSSGCMERLLMRMSGCRSPDLGVERGRVPVLGRVRPAAVVPEHREAAVVGAQFQHLRVHVVQELSPAFRVAGLAAEVGRVAPVQQRVVEAVAHAALLTGVYEFGQKIALRGRPGRREVGDLGVPEAEALVVPRGQDHVAHAGVLGQRHPFVRVVVLRIEAVGQPPVFLRRNALLVHRPLVTGQEGVQPPMDKHAEAGVVPPRKRGGSWHGIFLELQS